jgi:hypothetical protein
MTLAEIGPGAQARGVREVLDVGCALLDFVAWAALEVPGQKRTVDQHPRSIRHCHLSSPAAYAADCYKPLRRRLGDHIFQATSVGPYYRVRPRSSWRGEART